MNKPYLTAGKRLGMLALLLAPPSLFAQTDLRDDVLFCAARTVVIERLACFDDVARALAISEGVDSAERAVLPPPATEVGKAVASPVPATSPVQGNAEVAAFGRNEGEQQAGVSTNAQGAIELSDTVVAIKRVEPTKLQITLSSGQVWRQTVGRFMSIKKGDTVQISQSGWGNEYRLFVDGRKGFIQVVRQL